MRSLPLENWHRARGGRLAETSGDVTSEVLDYGNVEAEYAALLAGGGLFDASARDRLLITGDDAVTFLQGLATHDIAGLAVGASVEAAFITPKGKLVADARVTRLEDGVLLDLEAGRAAALQEHMLRYLVNEEAELVYVSEALAQLQLWGDRAAEVIGLGALEPGSSTAVPLAEAEVVGVRTVHGVDLYVPVDIVEDVANELTEKLASAGGAPVGRLAVDALRIARGIGRFGIDWNESTNPLEAGLDRALSFDKGCYVGQEVVAKATYIGRVNRRLVRLRWKGEPVAADTPLLGGKAPGRVTSSAKVPGTDEVVALGYVRRDVTEAGSVLRVGEGDDAPEATVEGWPLGSKDKPVD